VNILDNHFTRGSDQVSFENASGLVRDNIFFHASDDGLDIDNASEPTIENNIILDAGNDGIELRLHNYTGPTLKIVIRGNYIAESEEDGIQLIDYPGASSRDFLIEGNTLVNNLMVGLGCMADGNTDEDFAGSPMVESVRVIGNTIVGSPIGVTGGDNMLLLNNIIAGNFQFGVKRVAGSSLVSHNAFWGNATHHSGSNVESSTTMIQDPDLDGDYHLEAGSPCIDAGAISIVWNGKKVSSKAYLGMAPDLGAHEGPAGPIGPLSVPAPSSAGGMRVMAVHPNPSSRNVAISFTLTERSPARIELVDLAGRKILVRDLGAPGRGNHVVRLHETRSLPAGVYHVRLVQGERSVAAPMVVAR
jgi:parallel beta-helix repeat protein